MKSHRRNVLHSLAIAGGMVALAMAPVPGKWRIMDDTRVVFTYPTNVLNISYVKVSNWGPDEVTVTAKITGMPVSVVLGVVPAGTPVLPVSDMWLVPAGTAKVIIQDELGLPDPDPDGAQGTLFWIG